MEIPSWRKLLWKLKMRKAGLSLSSSIPDLHIVQYLLGFDYKTCPTSSSDQCLVPSWQHYIWEVLETLCAEARLKEICHWGHILKDILSPLRLPSFLLPLCHDVNNLCHMLLWSWWTAIFQTQKHRANWTWTEPSKTVSHPSPLKLFVSDIL